MFDLVAHALHRPHVSRLRRRVGRKLRPIRVSRQAEAWYHARLIEAVDAMRARAKEVLLRELKKMAAPSAPGARDADPWQRAIDELSRDKVFNSLKGQAAELGRLAARRALFWVDDRLAREVSRSLGVDIRSALQYQGRAAERLKEYAAWNADLISTLPDRLKDDLGEKLSTAWASGMRVGQVEDLVDDVVERAGEACEANAALIARDQMNKMNAAFNQVRQTELGIIKYQWRTSDDERVRPEHQEMETGGENEDGVYRWDEPGPLTGTIDGRPCHPGEDIQCRCDAIPIFDLEQEEAA